jgi:hypothetical protein
MTKLLKGVTVALSILTAVGVIWLGTMTHLPAATSPGEVMPTALPTQLATAPTPPTLVPAILNGEPIHVLWMTRFGDTVLVRCYPGYEPTLTVRSMGSDPAAGGQQEGVLTCMASEN